MRRFAVISAIFLLALVFGCTGMEKMFSVKYEVLSNCSGIDITYANSSGVNTDTHQTLFPWTEEHIRTTPFDVYLLAYNGTGCGTITANVYVGGTLYKSEIGTSNTAAITGTILKDH